MRRVRREVVRRRSGSRERRQVRRLWESRIGGLAADLKAALNHYSNADRKQTGIDQGEAVHALLTQLDIMRVMFHGVDYMAAVRGTPQDRIKMLPIAIEHALNLKVNGEFPKDRTESKKQFMKGVAGLVKAFRIASGTLEADEVKDEVGFFTAVQAAIRKMDAGSGSGRSVDEADLAISQLLNEAHNGDGRHIDYLEDRNGKLSHLDPDLFDHLKGVVR